MKRHEKKKTSTKWMVLPIPTNPVKLTAEIVFKKIEDQINQKNNKPAKKKPSYRTIDDDWMPPW